METQIYALRLRSRLRLGLMELQVLLPKDPRFICFNCGRVADFKENLCNPMPLD